MRALVVLLALVFAGCFGAAPAEAPEPEPVPEPAPRFFLSNVGQSGPEPTMGITSDACLWFQALELTMRSCDGGATWNERNGPLNAPITLDPMLWVDTTTDRVFTNQLYLGCSYLSFTDDGGETWISNPAACGVPVNDHQKVMTGPYVEGSPIRPAGDLAYPNVVYYAYNAIVGSRVAISIDGGLTWPYTATSNPGTGCAAGLHGHPTAAPNGYIYIPNRSNCGRDGGGLGGPVVTRSMDNGLTWDQTIVADDIGTADHDKNGEIAADIDGNLYLTWPGADNRLYMATSTDNGDSWSQGILVTPELGTVTMPVAQAGEPGRVAFAYYGVDDARRTEAPDLVDEDTHWFLYVTYSLNALDSEPAFLTVQATPDPIQVGAISTNSGDAPPGSRNLLDFIDMVIDTDGRVFVAYADGCTGDCALRPDRADPEDSRDDAGMVAIQETGPSLFNGTLMPTR